MIFFNPVFKNVFKRFKRGDAVIRDGKLGIVLDETHAPYIDGNNIVLGKYHVHHAGNEIICVGGEMLERYIPDNS